MAKKGSKRRIKKRIQRDTYSKTKFAAFIKLLKDPKRQRSKKYELAISPIQQQKVIKEYRNRNLKRLGAKNLLTTQRKLLGVRATQRDKKYTKRDTCKNRNDRRISLFTQGKIGKGIKSSPIRHFNESSKTSCTR